MGAVTPKHHVLDLKVDQTFASHAEEGPSWIDLIIADHPPKSRFAVGYVFRAVDEQVDSVATVAVASYEIFTHVFAFSQDVSRFTQLPQDR
jgi:hypothetical protein